MLASCYTSSRKEQIQCARHAIVWRVCCYPRCLPMCLVVVVVDCQDAGDALLLEAAAARAPAAWLGVVYKGIAECSVCCCASLEVLVSLPMCLVPGRPLSVSQASLLFFLPDGTHMCPSWAGSSPAAATASASVFWRRGVLYHVAHLYISLVFQVSPPSSPQGGSAPPHHQTSQDKACIVRTCAHVGPCASARLPPVRHSVGRPVLV